VLGIMDDQSLLAVALADHEIEADGRGVDQNEGHRSIIVATRGDRAMPFAEVEDCRVVLRTDK
jgi:hypothetical protein